MNDTDKILIGTAWSRSQGHHAPAIGLIDQVNSSGPRLKLADGSHRRLKWMELDFGWKPDNNSSAKRFTLWKLATKTERLEHKVVQNGSAPIMTEPEVATRECHGPWHRHGPTKDTAATYDLIPINEFSVVTRGPNPGQLSQLCDSCRQKQRDSDAKRKREKSKHPTQHAIVAARIAAEIKPLEIEPVTVTETGVVYRWKVTVVQPTEHYVQAKDFLDAAAQVANLGEVTRVEKL